MSPSKWLVIHRLTQTHPSEKGHQRNERSAEERRCIEYKALRDVQNNKPRRAKQNGEPFGTCLGVSNQAQTAKGAVAESY